MVYWIEYCPPPQIYAHEESVNVSLFINRVFADLIKMRSSWMRVGPKFNNCRSVRGMLDTDTHREGEGSQANEGRDWCDAKEHWRLQEATGN